MRSVCSIKAYYSWPTYFSALKNIRGFLRGFRGGSGKTELRRSSVWSKVFILKDSRKGVSEELWPLLRRGVWSSFVGMSQSQSMFKVIELRMDD